MKKIISTDLAPAAIGPYSQGVAAEPFIFTSGQIPIDPTCGKIAAETIEAQSEQVMKNLKAILAEAGVGMDRIVKTTCFLADMADFAAFNAVYSKYFPENPPARSCFQVAALPMGAKVEVECIAVR
ncbi:MAG: RidA family protein [Clostridiaceae bacterium]|nr:RidA family protein [Clostridiaceae bacterium]